MDIQCNVDIKLAEYHMNMRPQTSVHELGHCGEIQVNFLKSHIFKRKIRKLIIRGTLPSRTPFTTFLNKKKFYIGQHKVQLKS